jgi:hypothetical protein
VTVNATTNLPTILDTGNQSDRLIKGIILRCVDGRWSARDGTEFADSEQFLVIGTTEALQRWMDRMPADTVMKEAGKPLPDVKNLNGEIPVEHWEKGFDGRPRAPWQHVWVAYLIHITSADAYTFLNSTVGARLAVQRLTNQAANMRGANVAPIVTLSSTMMETSFGKKRRPHFHVVEWRELGNWTAPHIDHNPSWSVEQFGKPVKPIITEEALDDKLPFEKP